VLAIIPSTKSLGLSQNISCKLHGKKFLVVDTSSFKLMCKICSDSEDNNIYNTDLNNALRKASQSPSSNLEITNAENSSDEEEKIECNVHPTSKGSFYCDDCKIFLCKSCFSKNHRLHNSNLPVEISANFKLSLKQYFSSISLLEPKIMESIKTISDLEAKIKRIRETSFKRLEESCNKINKLCVKQADAFLEEYKVSVDNVDTETNTILVRLNALTAKIKKTLEEILSYKAKIDRMQPKDFYILCVMKRERKQLFKEAIKIFEDSKYLLNYIIIDTIRNAKIKISQFDTITLKFNKKLNLYRNSVINSVQKGISSYSYKIKRFTKYSKGGIKYFKCSSVIFKSYSAISVVGFNICGLVRSILKKDTSVEINNTDYNQKSSKNNKTSLKEHEKNTNIKNNNFNTETNLDENSTPSIKYNIGNIVRLSSKVNNVAGYPNEKVRVPIKIIIKEAHSNDISEYDVIFEEEFYLTDILNSIDPTITFYLKKSINLKPETLYLFSVVNMDNEAYLEIWNGEVPKFFQKDLIQTIQCNTNLLKFAFYIAEGIESDFTEFDSGIIADVLYSYKHN
jgi:hypothetical protein